MSYFSNLYAIQRAPIPFSASDIYFDFFSKKNIVYMSREITNRLTGVHPNGKNIVVPDRTIISVMDSIWNSTSKDISKLTMMTISYIVNYIRDEYQIEAQNAKLSIWVTNYGPETGLRQHSGIKIREKRPNFSFVERY